MVYYSVMDMITGSVIVLSFFIFVFFLYKIEKILYDIVTIMKIIIAGIFLPKILFTSRNTSTRNYYKLIPENEIKEEIKLLREDLNEEEVCCLPESMGALPIDNIEHLNDKDERMDRLYKYFDDLRFIRDLINKKTLIKEIIMRLNIPNNKMRQMDSVITDIAELLTERNMTALGKLAVEIASYLLINVPIVNKKDK